MREMICLSVFLLMLSVASVGSLFGQQTQLPDTSQPTQANQQQPASQHSQAFKGTVVKQGKDLMLKDSSGVLTYKLEDAAKAKAYIGKSVTIQGTLDSSTNTLHITSIQSGS